MTKLSSYKELYYKALQLSFSLQAKGITKNDIVIQCIDRSIEMIIGLIAILMVEAIYFPIHIEDPIERIHSLYCLTECKIILSRSSISQILKQKEMKVFDIDQTNNDVSHNDSISWESQIDNTKINYI